MSDLAAFAWGVGAGGLATGFGVLISASAAADFMNRWRPAWPPGATEGTGE